MGHAPGLWHVVGEPARGARSNEVLGEGLTSSAVEQQQCA